MSTSRRPAGPGSPSPTALRGLQDRRARVALAVLGSAALVALAAPAVGLSPLALVALTPLVFVVTSARSAWTALAIGAAASLATTTLVCPWLPGSFTEFFRVPTAASWAIFPFYALIGQPQLLLWSVVRWRVRDRDGAAVMVASAAAYAGLDWAAPKLFRDTLGFAFYADRWTIQVAELGGLPLLTFAAALVAEVACAVVLMRRRALAPAILAGALWAAILIFGAVRYRQVTEQTEVAAVMVAGIAQANIGNVAKEIALSGDLQGIVNTLAAYGKLSEELVQKPPEGQGPPDVVVWPETAYPLAYGAHRSPVDDDMDRELATWARERQTPLLFGGYRRAGETEYNSAILLLSDGEVRPYHKRHLIPFGEYIPLLGRARFGTGGTPRVLDLPLRAEPGRPASARVAPVICYESLLPEHAAAAVDAGAMALVNLTNDSWFVSSWEKKMHLAMAAVRSVETRRAQLRATNTGISALILPTGEIVGAGPIDEPAALRYRVPLLDTPPTLSTRWGPWAGPALLLLAVLALAGSRRRPAPAQHGVPAAQVNGRRG